MKQLIRTLAKQEEVKVKSFKLVRMGSKWMITSVSNGFACCEIYPTYPANVINVLKNIGYTQY